MPFVTNGHYEPSRQEMEETCNRKEKAQKESAETPERCRALLLLLLLLLLPSPLCRAVAELGIV